MTIIRCEFILKKGVHGIMARPQTVVSQTVIAVQHGGLNVAEDGGCKGVVDCMRVGVGGGEEIIEGGVGIGMGPAGNHVA